MGAAVKRRQAELERIITQARALPADDYDRMLILDGLKELRPGPLLGAAVNLVDAGDPESMTLAAQILLRLHWKISTNPHRMRIYRKLVEELCRPEQDPQVLAAALEHFVWVVEPAYPELLLSLLDHADPRVRANAIQTVVKQKPLYADESVLSKFMTMLAWDSDPTVRCAAAAALYGSYKDNPGGRARIREALVQLRRDPEPELRCYAILVKAAGNADDALAQFLGELAAAQPPWQVIVACAEEIDWSQASQPMRVKVQARLTRLQEQEWAQHHVPGRYPNQDDRAEILAEALSAAARGESDTASPSDG